MKTAKKTPKRKATRKPSPKTKTSIGNYWDSLSRKKHKTTRKKKKAMSKKKAEEHDQELPAVATAAALGAELDLEPPTEPPSPHPPPGDATNEMTHEEQLQNQPPNIGGIEWMGHDELKLRPELPQPK